MKFANIIVDISHEKLDRPFGYIIPKELEDKISIGTQIAIPFGKGNREITGYVIEITDKPSFDINKMKYIIRANEGAATVEKQLIELAWWIKKEYSCTMNQALKTYLVRFAKDFCALNLEDEFTTGHYLYDFGMANFKQTTDDPILLNVFGSLKDAVALGERAEEYAPPVTFQTIVDWMHGKSYHTKSFEMSMKKSKFIYRWIYKSYCYYCDNIRGKIFKNKY